MSSVDLLRIPIPQAVLRLAVPVILTNVLETAFLFVNGMFVGRIGTEALAAINASTYFVWLLYGLFQTATIGTTSLVAQSVGGGAQDEARAYAGSGLATAAGLVAVVWVVGFPSIRPALDLMGLTPEVARLAADYLRVLLLFCPAFGVAEIMSAVFRGHGDTRTPMTVTTVYLSANLLLAPVFILGWPFGPALGVTGAAVATGLAWLLAPLLYGALLRGAGVGFRLSPRRSQMRDIVRVGLPQSVQLVVFSFVYMVLTRILSASGTSAIAAVGAGNRVESLAFLVCLSFGAATTTLVGQYKGAANPAAAERSAWIASAMAGAVCAAASVCFVSMPERLAHVFSHDPEVVASTVSYLRWMALTEPFMALGLVLDGAFAGAGHTVPSLLISAPTLVLRLPLSWFFAVRLQGGVSAVWAVLSVLTAVRGILMAIWFHRGSWRHGVAPEATATSAPPISGGESGGPRA